MQEDTKDINTEIEDILRETPLVESSKKKLKGNIKTPSDKTAPRKKSKISKKKVIWIGAIVIVVIWGTIMLIPDSVDCEYEITDITKNTAFVNSVREQILNKGYADIGEGDLAMRVSPYLG